MSTCRLAVLLLIIVTASCLPLRANDPQGTAYTERRVIPPPKPFTLIADDAARERLEAAKALLEKREWSKARKALKELLDAKTDPLVAILSNVEQHDGITEEIWEYKSLSNAASPLLLKSLNSLSKAELATEEEQAQKSFNEAKQSQSPESLHKVATFYRGTKGATLAARELAGMLFKSGSYAPAANYYSQLLEATDPNELDPVLVFEALVSLRRAGMTKRAEFPDTVLSRYLEEHPLLLGKRKLTAVDVAKEIRARLDKDAEVRDLLLGFGGSLSRTAQGMGGTPDLSKPVWTGPTVTEQAYRHWLEKFQKLQYQAKEPVLPARFAVTGSRYSVPVVVIPTASGVSCVKAENGHVEWEFDLNRTPDKLAARGWKWRLAQEWLEQAEEDHCFGALWDSFSVGSLSRDNRYIYALNDCSFLPRAFKKELKGWELFAEELLHNDLLAFELSTGKVMLTFDPDITKPGPLTGSYFLSTPLAVDDKLYLLNEKDKLIRLVCLDNTDFSGIKSKPPVILWELPLGKAGMSLLHQPERRMQAGHISFDDGILVCQTNTGAVVAVEPISRQIVWAHIYRHEQEPPLKNDPEKPTPPRRYWHYSAPMIHDGKVIIAPPDADKLMCLSLLDGDVLWEVPRADEDRYVASVFDDKVVVVSTKSVKAYNLDDGKPAWKELATGMPSGHGTGSNGIYYLPLEYPGEDAKEGKPEICTIDLTKGTIVSHLAWKSDDVPGNLFFFNDLLLSQSIYKVTAYPVKK